MVDKHCQNCSWDDEQLQSKVVHVTADGGLVLDQHQVDVGQAAGNEEDLDASVIHGDEVEKYVNVSCEEDQEIEDLGSS